MSVQYFATTLNGYLNPCVERARNMSPLIDRTVQKVEAYIPPAIETADWYIQASLQHRPEKVLHICEMVASSDRFQKLFERSETTFAPPSTSRIGSPLGLRRVTTCRLLPSSGSDADSDTADDDDDWDALDDGLRCCRAESLESLWTLRHASKPRLLRTQLNFLPRFPRVVLLKAEGLAEIVTGAGRWIIGLTLEQKQRLQESRAQGRLRIYGMVVSIFMPGRAALLGGGLITPKKL